MRMGSVEEISPLTPPICSMMVGASFFLLTFVTSAPTASVVAPTPQHPCVRHHDAPCDRSAPMIPHSDFRLGAKLDLLRWW